MPSFERPEVTPIRTQRVPQTIETPVTFVPVPGAYVRFAYSRSSDSMANQIEGQDYVCFRHNDQRLVFVVADGVGSSFCGNLASRILGDNLLDWFWSLDIAYLGGDAALNEAATSYLNRLQKQAQHEVEEYDLPDAVSPLIKQALEAQRSYGSEAIFAACRIDHPGMLMPEGLVSLFWMGDTRITVLGIDGRPLDLNGSWENANRWSTVQGVKGSMSAWMNTLKGIGRTVAYTDGLSAHDDKLLDYPDDKLDREIREGARLPTSDDVAFIDVVLRTAQYEGYPDPDLPDPNLERPHLEQIWNPTGAETYELSWTWPGSGNRHTYMIQEARNPALVEARTINVPQGQMTWKPADPQPPGQYYYRVRAVKRFGGLTPWSELRQTRVAHPTPAAPELFPVEPDRAAVLHWEGDGEWLDYIVEQSANAEFEEPETVYEGRGTAWAIPTGKPGTYYYRVRAVSDGGSGPWSDVQEVTIILPPPPTPHLAAIGYGYAHGEYELRWQPVPRATHYELEWIVLDDAGHPGEPEVIELEDTIYHITGQPVGQYHYRVRACNESTQSGWSNQEMALVVPVAPSEAPALTLEGPDEDGLVSLSWTEIPSADEYLIETSDTPSFDSARVYTQAHCTLDLTRREPGAYYFRICGVNRGGDGPWSNVEQFAIVPGAPDWIEAQAAGSGSEVAVTWGAVGGPVDYLLELTTDDADYREVYRGGETHFELANLPAAASLRFRVRSELPGVCSGWATGQSIKIKAGAGDAPTLSPPDVGDTGEIELRWSAAADATGYLLEVSRDEDFADFRTFEFKKLGVNFRPPAAGQYWFRVRARIEKDGQAKEGAYSETLTIQVKRPAAPRLWPLDPVRPDTPYEVTWTGVPGCVYYELQESGHDAFRPRQTSTMRIFHPAQKVALPGREAGKVYYRVRAADQDDQSSVWSNVLAVEIQN